MDRVKDFAATGIAPNGKLYAGDLNLIQDEAAALSDLAQHIDLSSIAIGESGLQLLHYGSGEARLSGALRTDGIARLLGGLYVGVFTTTTRDAIVNPPTYLVVANSTTAELEWNTGTPSVPVWTAIGSIPDSSITTAKLNDRAVTGVKLAPAGSDVASAGALAISIAPVQLVTGTTTITSITAPGGAVKGDSTKLIFQGAAITVRNQNNIKLSAGMDAVFVQNEVLELVYDGTNYVEAHRSPLSLSTQSIVLGAKTSAPLGHVAEDGSAISRTTYAGTFNNLGTAHGTGDGSTTFNLPDSRGRGDVAYVSSGGHSDVSTVGNNEGTTLASRRPKHPSTLNGSISHTLGLNEPGHGHDNPAGTGDNPGTAGLLAMTSHAFFTNVVTSVEMTGITLTGGVSNGSLSVGAAGNANDTAAYLVRPRYMRL